MTTLKRSTETPGLSDDPSVKDILSALRGDDIRSKTDMKDWKSSPTFSLDKSPPIKKQEPR